MNLIPLLTVSALSLVSAQTNWTFDPQGLTAVLSQTGIENAPLRLSCTRQGFLEISILSGSKAEVTLIGPSQISLTLWGDGDSDGRITSQVYFKSLAVEFLRQEGDVEVVGGRSYRLHLSGARHVLQSLENSCLPTT